jgi:hypothetical protein
MMMFDDEVKLVLKMPAGLRREFKHFATDRDTSMSALVRDALRKMMQEAKAAPAAEAGQ